MSSHEIADPAALLGCQDLRCVRESLGEAPACSVEGLDLLGPESFNGGPIDAGLGQKLARPLARSADPFAHWQEIPDSRTHD